MKIKTSELVRPALDWAVCAAEGQLAHLTIDHNLTHPLVISRVQSYGPSFIWSQGGPIIEREGIDLYCNVPSGVAAKNKGWLSSWRAAYRRCGVGSEMFYAPDPLIAAMRCFVASKLGDEVDVPEGLQ